MEQRYYSAYGNLIWRKGEEKGTLQERFAFTGKERDRETGYDYFGARYYSQELGMWLSVDPLAYLYPDITPYAYCNWNPIKFVDPDGKEVHNMMNPYTSDPSQYALYVAATRFPDKTDQIFYISHGSSDKMYPMGITDGINASEFVEYIKTNSSVWSNEYDKSKVTIVLLSCETGKGENSIAEQISVLLPLSTIIAPNDELKAMIDLNGNVAIYGTYKKDAKTLEDCKDKIFHGCWNVFQNGTKARILNNPRTHSVYIKNYED